MKPTLAAEEVRRNLTQYLTTTFALADESVREALDRFLNHPELGIFRGPYLRIRTPFRPAEEGWRRCLEWAPGDFEPYRHQARAFERLSTFNGPAEPTLITTGTGSGKTESFLIPVLDHCKRERKRGRIGVKAVLLYPMNALATDQALRLNSLLQRPELRDVTAALYIGDTPETGYPRVMTERAEIRRSRPDILITNYKMLDLLLQRVADVPLWEDAEPAYVVVDEFHTYDGAQGTDVAMLLRRLAAATGRSEPGRPLGTICPVATSATLGEGDDEKIRAVATTVFGTEFTADSIVNEDRLLPDEFIDDIDYTLPLPDPQELASIPDPHGDERAMGQIMEAVTGRADLSAQQLGQVLSRHILTRIVLDVLAGVPKTPSQVLEQVPVRGAYNWGVAVRLSPRQAAAALARFVALLSVATDARTGRGPFLHIETHLWVRSISRLLRAVGRRPGFGWYGEAAPPLDADSTLAGTGRELLPAVYCRHCGRSGWAALSPEKDPQDLITDPAKIYRAGVTSDKRLVRTLITATDSEVDAQAMGKPGPAVVVLEAGGHHVRPLDPGRDLVGTGNVGDVFVLADLGHTKESNRAAEIDECPACGLEQGTRFLGAGPASLASVAITELFTGGELAIEQRKTLLFNDSVQDAAHRAGFVANRSYGFSLRLLLASMTESGREIPLNELISDVVKEASDPAYLPAVVPPDLHDRDDVDALLAGESSGSKRTWDLIGERLAFATIMEFGLRSRLGRTLELTRTLAAEVALEDPDRVARLALDIYRREPARLQASTEEPSEGTYVTYVRGLLERLRMRGAISHEWLEPWIAQAGTKRFGAIWGKRPDGMPAFPRGLSAPRFLMDRRKDRSEFDSIAGARLNWYQDWTGRCLGLDPQAATSYLSALLPALADEGVIAKRTATDGATVVYGLRPGHVQVNRLDADVVTESGVGCDVCHWEQTVHPDRMHEWIDGPCPRFRCTGHLMPRQDPRYEDDYYRRLYLSAEPFRVNTAEHTGALTRPQREKIERDFRDGARYTDPNVLCATPTLELGIDIGDLSVVILGSLPRRPANYVQRAGRAGRRDGDALLLTLIGRNPRDRYYLADPLEMIAGEIAPPGCYLSAVEILRRQYVAHLVDLAARDRLPGVSPLPSLAMALFDDSGWLAGFTEAAVAEGASLADRFLGLFGTEVSAEAAAELREFATGGLTEAARRVESVWTERLADLRARLEIIKAAEAAMVESDPQQRNRKRELRGERRAVAGRIGDIGRGDAHSALVDLGLLPNYSLIDTRTALEATLNWEDRDGEDRRYHSELREYERSAAIALTEFAPGNHFYVRGYRHKISGLDIGSAQRPAWQQWRICQECGYVRTPPAAFEDTTACPRCDNDKIGDTSALVNVLVPTRVTAHDLRDDVRIRDDHDERQRRYYETAVAVDIPSDEIAPGSWRHARRAFGVDFTRHAVVREFNLGALQMNRPPDEPFAGDLKRINEFYACTSCGGTTADGPPTQTHFEATGYTYDSSPSHHRPWCPQRRGQSITHVPLILAHELRTEALRILVPAATTMIAERTITFQAALMAGVAKKYGGDPDHLAIVHATMPDPQTGQRRRFIVLHDTLPGGTGYLHRMASEEGFREVLEEALEVVERCSCAEEEGKAACHRCLLSYVPGDAFDKADRGLAVEMLHELLDGWETGSVASTDDISLWAQVESELEARFLALLKGWAAAGGAGRSLATAGRVNDRRTADLRITAPDGTVVHWQVILQNTIKGTRPDVVFRRLDATPLTVAVYLDGYEYHASPEFNRLADDAVKRARLRAEGHVVFQLTWDDIKVWETGQAPESPVWKPYQGNAQKAAQGLYLRLGGDPAELPGLIWTNPVRSLLAFLTDPELRLWNSRSVAAVAGLLRQPGREHIACGPGDVSGRLVASLRGEPLPGPGSGELMLVRVVDMAGCPVTVVVEQQSETWTAFAVVDDRTESVAADGSAHARRWKAWLYWGNLLQFLSFGRGDGGQLAYTGVAGFDPAVLSVNGGAGWLSTFRTDGESTGAGRDDDGTPSQDSLSSSNTSTTDEDDPAWTPIQELLDPDEPGLAELAQSLAAAGVPVPEIGYELGEHAWLAELAWPSVGVGIVLAGDDRESADRDAAFAADGWEVRVATAWTAEELIDRMGGHE